MRMAMYLRTSHALIGLSIFAALWFFWPVTPKTSYVPTSEAANDAPVATAMPREGLEMSPNPPLVESPFVEDPEIYHARGQQPELLPMPAPSLPLALTQSALAQRALVGDLPAAMRLLDESKCCGTRNISMNYLLKIRPTGLDPEEAKFFGDLLDGVKTHEQTMQQRCGDLIQSQIDIQTAQKWARAAGDPVSVIDFARSPPLFGRSIAEQIKRLQERERDAIPSLHRLVSQGNLDAVMLLGSLHATPNYHGDLGSLVQQDWESTAVYNLLYLRAGGRAYRSRLETFSAQMSTRLSPEQLQSAKARALEIYNTAFAGRIASEYGVAFVAPGLQQEAGFTATARYPGASACPTVPGTQTQDQKNMMMRIFAKMRQTGASPPGHSAP